MRILITGGAGFVGSNLSILIKTKYPEYEVIAVDNLKRRGSEFNQMFEEIFPIEKGFECIKEIRRVFK